MQVQKIVVSVAIVCLTSIPAVANSVGLVIVDEENSGVIFSDPTGNAPPPLVIIDSDGGGDGLVPNLQGCAASNTTNNAGTLFDSVENCYSE